MVNVRLSTWYGAREGASVDAKNAEEATPLHWAAARGDLKCVELLLKAGANPAQADGDGAWAAHPAIRAACGQY